MPPVRRAISTGVIVGIVFLMFLYMLPVDSHSSYDSPVTRPDMVKDFIVAADTTEFTAESFADTYNTFTDDSYAVDGDWGTAVYETTAVTADYRPVAIWNDFDQSQTGSGTITQVDVVIRLSVSGTNNDEWGWILVNLGSDTTLRAEATGDQSLTNLTYTDVAEPDDASWSWSDVWSCQIDLDYDKVTSADNFDIYIYEICLKVTYESGDNYEVTVSEVLPLSESVTTAMSVEVTVNEVIAVSDSSSLAMSLVISVFEVLSLAAIVTADQLIIVTIFESIGFASVVTTTVDLSTTINEVIALSSSLAADIIADGYSILINEIIGISSMVTTTLDASITISEVIDFFESVAAVINPIDAVIINVVIPIGGSIRVVSPVNYLSELFLSPEVWGFFGPALVVIAGYVLVEKDKVLGVIWFIIECLAVAYYAALIEAYPYLVWHMYIILLGGLLTLVYGLWDR